VSKTESLLTKFVEYCEKLEDAVIVVEGKRDNTTLKKLGIRNKIIVKGGRSLDDLVDLVIQSPIIIILTDFDQEGKKLRRQLKREIQLKKGHGTIDSIARQILYRLCRAYRISEIEDLDHFL